MLRSLLTLAVAPLVVAGQLHAQDTAAEAPPSVTPVDPAAPLTPDAPAADGSVDAPVDPAAPGVDPAAAIPADAPADAPAPALDPELHSYYFGYVAASLLQREFGFDNIEENDVDFAKFQEGFNTAMGGDQPAEQYRDEARLQSALQALDALVRGRREEVAAESLAAGQAYLEQNKAKEGVTTTASGLQYEVIEAGDGEPIGDVQGKQALVNYRGTLIDGTEFDGNMDGEPVAFGLDGTIPGFSEALRLMPIGAHWKITIPSDLAYGPAGQGPIPPNSTLIFELKLNGLEDAPPPPALPEGIDPALLQQLQQAGISAGPGGAPGDPASAVTPPVEVIPAQP